MGLWVMGHMCNRSHGSWDTTDDPLSINKDLNCLLNLSVDRFSHNLWFIRDARRDNKRNIVLYCKKTKYYILYIKLIKNKKNNNISQADSGKYFLAASRLARHRQRKELTLPTGCRYRPNKDWRRVDVTAIWSWPTDVKLHLCKLHTYYIHITYILHTYYLHITYILHTYYIHITYILLTYYIHITYILHTYYMHITYILLAYYMHITCILHTYYIHITYILHTYYIHIIYILYTYYLHITYILLTYYIHITYILYTYYLHITYILHTYYIHITYILHTYYTRQACRWQR